MPSASKAKGSGFEREVAKFLTNLYGESFIKAPGSGAYTGGSNSHRKQLLHEGQIRNFKGDIVPGQSFPLMNAEAKFYADFAFHQLFLSSNQLEIWIKQVITASDQDDLNILFMKFNRKGKFVAVQHKYNWNLSCNHFIYNSVNFGTWLIFDLDEFFKHNSTQVKSFSSSKQLLTESQD